MITLNHYLALGALLFAIGLFGALAKKNAIAVLMGIELMLNAVNINLVAFNRFLNPAQVGGQVFAIFVIAVAAAEVAVGLALVINLYRQRLASNVDEADWLKW
ncbi:MAG: NADH-quinone oxidoreductase subunit NuoK [Moorellaceae bacterium]